MVKGLGDDRRTGYRTGVELTSTKHKIWDCFFPSDFRNLAGLRRFGSLHFMSLAGRRTVHVLLGLMPLSYHNLIYHAEFVA